ncbi:MAG: hypothetical protein A2148_06820 [Chloroflexi bacterium RBG_16_68_14]|nr:MAG: hypothetical protein A2148_06820 [Chloroflexi bacterium RBG_16_68_14]
MSREGAWGVSEKKPSPKRKTHRVSASATSKDGQRAEQALRESEAWFSWLFQASPLSITVSRIRDGYIVDVNNAFLRLMGYSREAVIGRTAIELGILVDPGDRERAVRAVREQGAILDFPLQVRTNDGQVRDLLCSLVEIQVADEPCVLAMSQDVTGRKRAEATLRESEERLRTLIGDVDAIVWEASATTWQFSFVSGRAEAILGYPVEQWTTEPDFWANHIYPDDREHAVAFCAKATAEARDHEFAYRMVAKDGRAVWLHDVVRVITDSEGKTQQLRGIMVDITERQRAEQEIRLLFRLLLSITQAMSEAPDFNSALEVALCKVCKATGWEFGEAWVPGPDGQALVCASSCHADREGLEEFRRFSREMTFPLEIGLPGRVWASQQPEWIEDVSAADPAIFPRAAGAAEAGLKAALGVPLAIDGQVLAVLDFFLSQPREEDRRMVEVVSAVAAQLGEVVQRKRAEEALRESEERFRLLAENAQDVIFRYRLTEPIGYEYISPAGSTMSGYAIEEFYADPDFGHKIIHPDDLAAFDEMNTRLLSGPVELRWVRKDGSTVWTEQRNVSVYGENGNLIAIEGIVRDVTERKRAEEALRRAREELEGKVERALLRRNPYGLTFRELTVLHLVAAGRADKQIAAELGISPLTVHKHVSNILAKMNAASRTEAGMRALREGLLD